MPFVQSNRSNTETSITFDLPNSIGSILIAICAEEISAGNITGCSSTGEGAWQGTDQQSHLHVSRLFWVVSKGTESNEVSFTTDGSPSGFGQIGIVEYSLVNALDSSNSGTGDIDNPIPVTTSHPNCLVVGGFDSSYDAYLSDGTWTVRTPNQDDTCRTAIADATFEAAGTYAPNLSSPTAILERHTLAFFLQSQPPATGPAYLGRVRAVGSAPAGNTNPFLGTVTVIDTAPTGVADPYLGQVVEVSSAPAGNTNPSLGSVTVVGSAPAGNTDPYLGRVMTS